MSSSDEQSVPSLSRSSPESQSPNAPGAVSVATMEVSQPNTLETDGFDAYEMSPLNLALGSSTRLSSELGDFHSAVAATNVAPSESDMPSLLVNMEIPYHISSRLLKPKQKPDRTVLVNKLVSQMICSFPETKLIEDSCPPFIHYSTFRRSLNVVPSEDPIVICQRISRQYVAREAHINSSVWDAIVSEQERIYDQRASFHKWLHLASAQALTIYLLMLTAEGESVISHYPNLSITLLFTLGEIFRQMHQILPGFVAAEERSGGIPLWEDWIFAESKLRTGAVYFILALQFNVEFGLPCDREGDYEFEDVELPATKTLWLAKNEISWHEEFDLTAQPRHYLDDVSPTEARLTYGDLVRLNKSDLAYENHDIILNDKSKLADRIKKWKTNMDEFGILVVLCSTSA